MKCYYNIKMIYIYIIKKMSTWLKPIDHKSISTNYNPENLSTFRDLDKIGARRSYLSSKYNSEIPLTSRSKKDRLYDEKNFYIRKQNQILFQKIKKIMQKDRNNGKNSSMLIESIQQNQSNNFSLCTKPVYSPKNKKKQLHYKTTTKSYFPSLKIKRSGSLFAYSPATYDSISEVPQQDLRTKQKQQNMGNYQFFGWKISAILLQYGQFLILQGSKGKRIITKRYYYEKICQNFRQLGIQQWIASKFQNQI